MTLHFVMFLGVYAAAFDSEIEWVIIKGISHYTDSSCCGSDKWQHFASAMAASVVKHILKEPIVLQDWPCYKGVHKDSLNQGKITFLLLRFFRINQAKST